MTDLVGWWPLHDDSAQDYSGNGYDGNLNNNPNTGVSGTQGIESTRFPGNNEYIDIGQPLGGVTASDPFSISVWVRPFDNGDSADSYNHRLLSNRYQNSGRTEIVLDVDGDTNFSLGGDSNGLGTEEFSLALNEWHHIVCTYNGSGKVEIYIDGELKDTDSGSLSGDIHSGNWRIGQFPQYSGQNGYYSGDAADLRMYNRVISPQEVNELYERGAQAAPPVDGTARYEFEGDVTDSWNSNDGTNNGASFVDGKYGQAASFNASGSDYVSVTDFSFDIPSNGFSVSGWIKPSFGNNNSSEQAVVTWHDSSSNNWRFRWGGGGWNYGWTNTNTSIDLGHTSGKWYHFCMVVDQESNLRGYWNSEIIETRGVDSASATSDLEIGREASASNRYFNGLIDDVRIYPYALSARQVSALYHGWNDIAGPTTDGLVAHYKLDGDVNDSAGSNDGTNNGVTFERGIRGQAGKFQRSNSDEIEVSGFPTFSDTDGFTFSQWVKQESDVDSYYIDTRDASNADQGFAFFYNSGNDPSGGVSIDDGPGSTPLFFDLPRNVWNHVTCTYKNSELVVYLNGKQVASSTGVGTGWTTDNTLRIGNSDNFSVWYLEGKMDDVRIYDRALEPWEIHDLYRYGTKGRDLREKLVRKKG